MLSGFSVAASFANSSLVRSTASEPCPPTAVQSVTPDTVKFGWSENSITFVDDVVEWLEYEVVPTVSLTLSRVVLEEAETVSTSDSTPDFCALIKYFPSRISENENTP